MVKGRSGDENLLKRVAMYGRVGACRACTVAVLTVFMLGVSKGVTERTETGSMNKWLEACRPQD